MKARNKNVERLKLQKKKNTYQKRHKNKRVCELLCSSNTKKKRQTHTNIRIRANRCIVEHWAYCGSFIIYLSFWVCRCSGRWCRFGCRCVTFHSFNIICCVFLFYFFSLVCQLEVGLEIMTINEWNKCYYFNFWCYSIRPIVDWKMWKSK